MSAVLEHPVVLHASFLAATVVRRDLELSWNSHLGIHRCVALAKVLTLAAAIANTLAKLVRHDDVTKLPVRGCKEEQHLLSAIHRAIQLFISWSDATREGIESDASDLQVVQRELVTVHDALQAMVSSPPSACRHISDLD